jgi:hypothetical protein
MEVEYITKWNTVLYIEKKFFLAVASLHGNPTLAVHED